MVCKMSKVSTSCPFSGSALNHHQLASQNASRLIHDIDINGLLPLSRFPPFSPLLRPARRLFLESPFWIWCRICTKRHVPGTLYR